MCFEKLPRLAHLRFLLCCHSPSRSPAVAVPGLSLCRLRCCWSSGPSKLGTPVLTLHVAEIEPGTWLPWRPSLPPPSHRAGYTQTPPCLALAAPPFASVGARQSQKTFFFKVLSNPIVFRLSTSTPEGHAGRIRGGIGVFCVLGTMCCLSAPHCPSQLASALPGPYSLQTVSQMASCLVPSFLSTGRRIKRVGESKELSFLSFPSSPTDSPGLSAGGYVDKEKRLNPRRQLTFPWGRAICKELRRLQVRGHRS